MAENRAPPDEAVVIVDIVSADGLDDSVAADDQPVRLMHVGLRRVDKERIAGEADNRAAQRRNGSVRHGASLLDLAKAVTGSDPMRAMILRCLIGASVFSAT